MKTISISMSLLIALLYIQGISAQTLSEKIYDYSSEDDIFFTSVESIPLSFYPDSGQIIVSSAKNPNNTVNTIIMRVNTDGSIVWQKSYQPAGSINFDQDLLIKNHRIGFNPDNESVIIVGQNEYGGQSLPSFIELDIDNGDVLDEHVYQNFMANFIDYGYINAVHTVMDGANAGAYMVGMGIVASTQGHGALITKFGSTSDFEQMYVAIDISDPYYTYLDVDVDDTEGYVIAVGVKRVDHGGNLPDIGEIGIVDVYETDGTPVSHYEYELGEDMGRFSAVKCIAPERVVIGGIHDGEGYVMQIDYTTGSIHWSRYITGYDEGDIGEIIEVEQDVEGLPVILGIDGPHMYDDQPTGPGIVARLQTNGLPDWAIAEEMSGGYADLEPQYTVKNHLSLLVGVESGTMNKLTFMDNTNGFYGCNNEVELLTYSQNEIYYSSVSRYFQSIADDVTFTPSFSGTGVTTENGCCWLPYFNPLPWNHPWENTYFEDDPAVIDLTGLYSGYNYAWHVNFTRDLSTWQTTSSATALSTSGSNNEVADFDFVWGNNPERTRYYIIATDANGCKGRDDGALTMVDDGGPVPRPDYGNSTYGANLQHPSYTYCQQSTGTDRYLYQHTGQDLGSNGFVHVSSSASLSYPNVLNGGTNYLSSTGTEDFEEEVEDDFNTGTTRVVTIETDVDVVNCTGGCAPGLTFIKWNAENGRRYYSIPTSNLTPKPKIVKYAYSLHLDKVSAERHEMVKRLSMPVKASGTIDPYDYLIPLLDDRYMDSYPTYSTSINNNLYLDTWYPGGASYPYSMDCHRRYALLLSSGEVTRLAAPEKMNNEEPLSNDHSIEVFPNPSKGIFDLAGIEGPVSIEVHDLEGRLVMSKNVGSEVNGKVQIDLRKAPAGFYLLQLKTAMGDIVVQKLIKE